MSAILAPLPNFDLDLSFFLIAAGSASASSSKLNKFGLLSFFANFGGAAGAAGAAGFVSVAPASSSSSKDNFCRNCLFRCLDIFQVDLTLTSLNIHSTSIWNCAVVMQLYHTQMIAMYSKKENMTGTSKLQFALT